MANTFDFHKTPYSKLGALLQLLPAHCCCSYSYDCWPLSAFLQAAAAAAAATMYTRHAMHARV